MRKNRCQMNKVTVFVIDEHDEVVQDNEYNVIKMIKDNVNLSTMLVFDNNGDIAIVRAEKDYSVSPFRYIVRRKLLIPMWVPEEDNKNNNF